MAENNYEVLSPWAEADAVPWRGINPRVSDLSGLASSLLVLAFFTTLPFAMVARARLLSYFA